MRGASVLVVLLLAGFGVPPVSAAPNCEDVTQDAEAVEGFYVLADDGVEVWQESNRVPGLQTQACTTDGRDHGADTPVAMLPPVPAAPSLGPAALCRQAFGAAGLVPGAACAFF